MSPPRNLPDTRGTSTGTSCLMLLASLVIVAAVADGRVSEVIGDSESRNATQPAELRSEPMAALKGRTVCFSDLWWGLEDSAALVADVTRSCVSEQADEAKFWWRDVRSFADGAWRDLRGAVAKCSKKDVTGCVALALGAARRQLRPGGPGALLLAQALRFFLRIVYFGAPNLLGCVLLPGILPAVWNTIMDLLILGQCLAGM